MTYSFTYSETKTFTVTHAKHIAAKVATDLKRIQRFYGKPSDTDINEYESEVIALLKSGYLYTVTYGFKKDGNWIEPTLHYTARDLIAEATNDDPGRIRPGANINGAAFYSYLTYTSLWNNLTYEEKEQFKRSLPFQRVGATQPDFSGYLYDDRTYSSGGRALYRASLRSYS